MAYLPTNSGSVKPLRFRLAVGAANVNTNNTFNPDYFSYKYLKLISKTNGITASYRKDGGSWITMAVGTDYDVSSFSLNMSVNVTGSASGNAMFELHN